MTTPPFLPYARQSIDAQDIQEVSQSLREEMITRGKQVEAFEQAIATYCDAKFAVAFNSGTTALMAASHAAGIGQHDRLLTTPNTFVASAGAGIYQKATPVFIDIDRNTGNINLEQLSYNLERTSTRGRAAIVPVHFSGIPVNMEALQRMIKDPNAIVIEDAAHAIGSCYSDGTKVGSCLWSDMTMFSFHPAKTITTGEGGMITTNNEVLYEKLRLFRNNGIERDAQKQQNPSGPWYYEVQEITGNFNFTEMQAALGLSQLKRIDSFIQKRRDLMKTYREALREIPDVHMFTADYDDQTAFHLCVVQINFAAYKTTRTEVMNKLKEAGIGTQVHYIPIYRFPFFTKKAGDISEYFPEMEGYYSQALSLPLYYDLSTEDVHRVVATLKKVLKKT